MKAATTLIIIIAFTLTACFSVKTGMKKPGIPMIEHRSWHIFGLPGSENGDECPNGFEYVHSQQSVIDVAIKIVLSVVVVGFFVDSRTTEYQCKAVEINPEDK